MNLGEAEKSFDYYTELLKVQSVHLSRAVDLTNSAPEEAAQQASEARD